MNYVNNVCKKNNSFATVFLRYSSSQFLCEVSLSFPLNRIQWKCKNCRSVFKCWSYHCHWNWIIEIISWVQDSTVALDPTDKHSAFTCVCVCVCCHGYQSVELWGTLGLFDGPWNHRGRAVAIKSAHTHKHTSTPPVPSLSVSRIWGKPLAFQLWIIVRPSNVSNYNWGGAVWLSRSVLLRTGHFSFQC